jgi:hypothetical protein
MLRPLMVRPLMSSGLVKLDLRPAEPAKRKPPFASLRSQLTRASSVVRFDRS